MAEEKGNCLQPMGQGILPRLLIHGWGTRSANPALGWRSPVFLLPFSIDTDQYKANYFKVGFTNFKNIYILVSFRLPYTVF